MGIYLYIGLNKCGTCRRILELEYLSAEECGETILLILAPEIGKYAHDLNGVTRIETWQMI